MTNERAIELLHRLQDEQFDGEYGDERREALSMAVRALEQNLVQESGGLVKDLVKDCISRKMVIDAMRKLPKWNIVREGYKNIGFSYDSVMFALDRLPSAQPETHDKRTETHACDCISRQEAIDTLAIGEELLKRVLDDVDVVGNEREKYEWGLGLIEAYIADMKDLPPAQPERKKGKWIWWYEEEFTEHATEYTPHCKCSECGRECAPSVATSSNFCRNCGADMRGENDE